MKIIPIAVPTPFYVGDVNVYLVKDDPITLIDVGPKSREGFDAGDRIVLPKLRRMGIKDVSVIVITHPDSDHIGGLGAVAKRFKDAKIVAAAGFRHDEDMQWCEVWEEQTGGARVEF